MSRDQIEKSTTNKIRIEEIEGSPTNAIVEINDRRVRCVSYTIRHEAGSLAEMVLCAHADTIIEETGMVHWVAIPQTIDEAVNVLRIAAKEGKINISDIAKMLQGLLPLMKSEDEYENPAD